MIFPSSRRPAQRAVPVARLSAAAVPCLVIAGAGLSAAPVWAQSAPETTLPPVVVSATGFAQPLAQALPSVSLISRAQIEESGAHNLVTLLEQVAGVQIATSGGAGQPANLFLRGFAGPDVLVLIDGVPMNAQDSTGVAYLSNLTTDQIERVEVVRGNVSAIYGSGAIGGVVLITTRTAGKTPRASMAVTAGSHGTETASANASGRIGRTTLQAGITRTTSQGISAIDPAQYPLANPNANGYGITTVNGSIQQELAAGQSLGLRAFRSTGRASYDSYAYAAPTDTNLNSTSQELVQVFSDNRINADWTSHLTLSQQATTNTVANFSASSWASTYRTEVRQMLWRNEVHVAPGWTATGGLDLQLQSISSITGDIAEHRRDAHAVFAGIAGEVGRNSVQFNLRQDAVDGYSGQTTGYLGYGRALGGGFKAIASYSTAFNAAPLGYLFAPYYGNPDLRPEKAHSEEAALQWTHGANTLRGTLFQTSAPDQWLYDFASSTFQNIGRTRTRGVELSGRGAVQGWRYTANLTLQQPLNTSAVGDPVLQRRARGLANLTLDRHVGAVLVGAAVHYSGPRWDRDGNGDQVNLGGYTTVDLTASGSLTHEWSWNARVQNLFDKQYQQVWGYNREPFGLFVGLRWTPDI